MIEVWALREKRWDERFALIATKIHNQPVPGYIPGSAKLEDFMLHQWGPAKKTVQPPPMGITELVKFVIAASDVKTGNSKR